MSWNAQRLFLCAVILATGCSAEPPPAYPAIIEHFDQLSQQTVASAGHDAFGTNLAPTYNQFVKSFQNEAQYRDTYSVHGPHILALAELIGETIKINEKLEKLSGLPVGDNAAGSSAVFSQMSFSDFDKAIQEDLKSMAEMRGVRRYVFLAVKLLAANLFKINSRVDILEKRHDV